MINTINILIKAHLTFIAEIIMNLISYIYGNKCKFKHKNNFWILSDPKYSNYINFFTDPRINLQNDVLNLLRDVFFYKDTPKINDIVVSVGAGLGHEILVLNESMNNTGKILCIEALPVLIPGLNLTIN